MKILVVYAANSVFKYPNLFNDFIYELDSNNGILRVSIVSREDQYEEHEHAVFRNWDYYLVEQETEAF